MQEFPTVSLDFTSKRIVLKGSLNELSPVMMTAAMIPAECSQSCNHCHVIIINIRVTESVRLNRFILRNRPGSDAANSRDVLRERLPRASTAQCLTGRTQRRSRKGPDKKGPTLKPTAFSVGDKSAKCETGS